MNSLTKTSLSVYRSSATIPRSFFVSALNSKVCRLDVAELAHTTRRVDEGLVRRMNGCWNGPCRLHLESSLRVQLPRTGKQSAARVAGKVDASQSPMSLIASRL